MCPYWCFIYLFCVSTHTGFYHCRKLFRGFNKIHTASKIRWLSEMLTMYCFYFHWSAFCPFLTSQLQLGVDGILLQDSTPQIKLPELQRWKMPSSLVLSHPVPQLVAQKRQGLAYLMLKTILASMSTKQRTTPMFWTECCSGSRNSKVPWSPRETSQWIQKLIPIISEACGALGWISTNFRVCEQ